MQRIRNLIKVGIVGVVVLYAGWLAVKWTTFRVFVDQDHALVRG